MKAALYSGLRTITLQDVDYVEPEAGYLVIDTRCSGICGSDLHQYFGEWDQPLTSAPGHETSGIVTEVGAGVDAFAPGDRVTFEIWSYCGRCVYCRRGLYNHCLERAWTSKNAHGGFAEFTTAHHTSVFRLPDTMSFEEGALVEPLAVCYRALMQANAGSRDRVAVLGGGTIGMLCLAVAKAIGVEETLITVKYESQARMARDFGADHVVTVSDQDVEAHVKDVTGGVGMDVVIETVGSAQATNDALSIVRSRGRVVLVGGYSQPVTVDIGKVVASEAVVTGSLCYAYSEMTRDFQAAIDLIDRGKIDATKVVTHRFPLTEIGKAFETAADKTTGSVKVHVYQ